MQRLQRFIPACAGNIFVTLATRFIPACAGNIRARLCRDSFIGLGRFIPACAGNILVAASAVKRRLPTGSSPRVRGTSHTTHGVPPYSVVGSSPRVRGTYIANAVVATAASWTVHPRVCGEHMRYKSLLRPVHPRVCGEHAKFISRNSTPPGGGSSPRVRGTSLTGLKRYDHSGSSPRVRGT